MSCADFVGNKSEDKKDLIDVLREKHEAQPVVACGGNWPFNGPANRLNVF
jgi:hypothetical protein